MKNNTVTIHKDLLLKALGCWDISIRFDKKQAYKEDYLRLLQNYFPGKTKYANLTVSEVFSLSYCIMDLKEKVDGTYEGQGDYHYNRNHALARFLRRTMNEYFNMVKYPQIMGYYTRIKKQLHGVPCLYETDQMVLAITACMEVLYHLNSFRSGKWSMLILAYEMIKHPIELGKIFIVLGAKECIEKKHLHLEFAAIGGLEASLASLKARWYQKD